jgi:hypothetical protein
LIDTGWRATQQRLLMLAFPEIDWFGAYFGLMVSPNDEYWHPGRSRRTVLRD